MDCKGISEEETENAWRGKAKEKLDKILSAKKARLHSKNMYHTLLMAIPQELGYKIVMELAYPKKKKKDFTVCLPAS